jgi:L,D-transpeptidase YcbB
MDFHTSSRFTLIAAACMAFASPSLAQGQLKLELPTPEATVSTPPANAQNATAPALPPLPLPKLSPAQAAYLSSWLKNEAEHGLVTGAGNAKGLSGEALVRKVLDRAYALHNGRIVGDDFLEVWALRPAAYDPLPAFAEAVATDRLPSWINSLTPPYAGYEGLKDGLAAYRKIRASGGWPNLTAKSPASTILARLSIEDKELPSDIPLVQAIQRAQKRYGLNPTGLLDARTLAALNVPVSERIASIMANMERWRWMPRNLPVNRVQVNIAAAVLTVFEGDAPISSMRAVTGSPKNQTPMLTSSIHSIVVNPPWNVPASIAQRELWPKGRAALKAQGYKIVGTPETGERIVQPAGPGSALGRLKFDFNNPFAVYLHDTPSRAKFASYDRLASHGCVRLEKPLALAELVMRDDPKYAGNIQSLIDTGKTQRVALPKQVAVYLLYWTAYASANGTINFREDPYAWDSLLAQKIETSSRKADNSITGTSE